MTIIPSVDFKSTHIQTQVPLVKPMQKRGTWAQMLNATKSDAQLIFVHRPSKLNRWQAGSPVEVAVAGAHDGRKR